MSHHQFPHVTYHCLRSSRLGNVTQGRGSSGTSIQGIVDACVSRVARSEVGRRLGLESALRGTPAGALGMGCLHQNEEECGPCVTFSASFGVCSPTVRHLDASWLVNLVWLYTLRTSLRAASPHVSGWEVPSVCVVLVCVPFFSFLVCVVGRE